MIGKTKTCVLIPAYNEEKNIGRVVAAVQAFGFPVVAVDDGSTDNTAIVLQGAGVPAIFSQVNQGKGAAIRKGFEWVLQKGYEAVIIMDADGQHHAGDLERFVSALNAGDADIVVGNRMSDPQGMPWLRRLTNRIMSRMVSLAAGQRIPDTQCGFRALSRRALEKIVLKTDRFEIASEMLMAAGRQGLRIRSVPATSQYHDEASHIRPLQDTLRFFKFYFRTIFSR